MSMADLTNRISTERRRNRDTNAKGLSLPTISLFRLGHFAHRRRDLAPSLRHSACVRKITSPAALGWSGSSRGTADRYRPKDRIVAGIADWTSIHFRALSAASRSNLLANQCTKQGLIAGYDEKSRKVRARGCPKSYRRASELRLDELGKG